MGKKEKIAVIGMGGLFPGSENLDQFWENLIGNRDLVTNARFDDFGADPALFYHEEKGKIDHCYALRGGFIRDFKFNPEGYRLAPDLLEAQDNQFKYSLYVAKAALQSAGYYEKPALDRCGVIVGNLSFPTRYSRQIFSEVYAAMAGKVLEQLGGSAVPVASAQTRYPADIRKTLLTNAPAALVAQALGLRSTHYSLDAACASSLYAVKLACDELLAGKADMMLAGAVSGADPLFIHMGFSYFHAYARQDEASAPMDRFSGGLTSAEGAGMIVLKRLADAQRDGDNILAVIEGVGLSNDGKGKFLLSPNPKGQRLAFERAYAQTTLQPDAIDYLECHATGTPLGDKTEFNSIGDFFVREGAAAPQVGSVKSNMGHLLTAAGMAGIIKVILAMEHRTIPATIKVSAPLVSDNGKIGPAQIVMENAPWRCKGAVPHAGINAFGFGGTNAHLILSAWDGQAQPAPAAPATPVEEPIAIVGMDVHFGDCDSLEAYYLSLFSGRQHFRSLPPERWKGLEWLSDRLERLRLPDPGRYKGAWLEAYDLDLLRFKIQPREAERLTRQQTLMLKVAYHALQDAGMEDNDQEGANVAVITAMESELEIHHRMGRWDLSWQINQALERAGLSLAEANEAKLGSALKDAIFQAYEDHSPSEHTGFIGNIISSRIAALMDYTGPAFTVSSNENAVYKALEISRNLLAMREVDAVVLGAIDLSGSLESVLSRHALHPVQEGPARCSWDAAASGWLIGEGAAAIVLKRASDAQSDRVYAFIDDLAIVQSAAVDLHGAADAHAVEQAAKTVLERQGLQISDIGCLEISGSGIPEEDSAELEGLCRAYASAATDLRCAVGSAKVHVGHTFSASGLAAIIKNALSLYYRFIPGIPGWEKARQPERLRNTPFYFPEQSRPWIPERGQQVLRAAISGLASDGTAAHLLLSEAQHPDPARGGPFLLKGGERLFPIRAADAGAMAERLQGLREQLVSTDFRRLSDECCERFTTGLEAGAMTLVLVAASGAALDREVRFFQEQLAGAWSGKRNLQTPAGSYFSAAPLGKKGKVALVYPGSGTAYPHMGTALFQAFPGLYDAVKSRVDHLSTAFFSSDLYPRTREAADAAGKRAQELALQVNALPMMAVGCTFAAVFTVLAQDMLAIPAESVIGFSMGETSAMWYGQGVWDTHRAEEKFLEAPLFREKVGGRMSLLSSFWKMPPEQARERWAARLVATSADLPEHGSLAAWFRQKAAAESQNVYLTFIHTDREVVLSGDREALDRLLEGTGFNVMPLALNNVVHHDFCRALESEFLEMHRLPIEKETGKSFYSSITLEPMPIDSGTLARNATEVCCTEVDFPRLVRKMAADGHCIFIEMGANATCTRWIGEILSAQDHVAVPFDRRGAGVLRNICGLVACLLAHQVPVDIRLFYEPESARRNRPKALNKTLRTGGPRVEALASGAELRQLYAAAATEAKRQAPLATPAFAVSGDDDDWPGAYISESNSNLPDDTGLSTMQQLTLTEKSSRKAENGLELQDYNDAARLSGKNVIWDEQDLLTFATGKISDVFGPEYAIIDTYRRRVMLPMPPYLLVSRVTRLEAKTNEYKPSLVTTEYDIPYNSEFATDGQIPWAVAVESGQCDLLLISYLGIDFQNKGEYVYRLLDCTLTFLDDLPFEGQTLRYDIRINSFVRSGNNLLFFFSYECFVQDRMVLKMDGGCAGFFSDEELAVGQGVVYKAQELEERATRKKQFYAPLLQCDKTQFSREDLLALVAGDPVRCFGEDYDPCGRNTSLRLPPEQFLMLDRITRLEREGGSAGLGFIEAEKDLLPDDWYFPCHFRDDEVLAGSLQAEGGGQLLRFFMLYLGMQRLTRDARFQPVLDVPQKVRCRKEVPAKKGTLIYRMDVKEIGNLPEPYVIADLEIIYEGYVAVFFENLGLRLQEKSNPTYLKSTENRQDGIYVRPVSYPVLLNEYHVSQFALGPVYKCFGEAYTVYEGRQLSRQPNTDLQFISRVREIQGERHVFNNKPVILAEYDVPENAWYYTQNAAPEMPYSVLMEVALQPCGFLGAYLGSTLAASEQDLFFRNLDGDGELLQRVDLRGKTVLNRACLESHTRLGGTVLQRYSFELSVDGAPFYRGNSSFGFFTRDDLSSQAGLDNGQHILSWLQASGPQAGGLKVNLDSLFGKMKLFRSANPASPALHLAGDQLRLIDTATIVREGGKYGKGYIFASKQVRPQEWFFTCHFYQDPVMPGSLGVEAILQAIQLFAIQQGLGDGLTGAVFHQPAPHRTVWKYRGQILQHDPEMHLEAHIKDILHAGDGVTVLADASLWKGALRIYEVTDLAVQLGA